MNEIYSLRTDFWGEAFKPAPKATDRKKKLAFLLQRSHDQHNNVFNFRIGNRCICERAMLILLGLVTNNRPPRIYQELKAKFVDGSFYKEAIYGKAEVDSKDKELKRAQGKSVNKSYHARCFIEWMTSVFADTCPTDHNKKFLPYENVQQLFDEYEAFCESHMVLRPSRAGLETFRNVFSSMESGIHLSKAKGSFPTCDICNNANDLLRKGKTGFNTNRREIILKYKRCHLLQQAQERKHQELTRLKAKTDLISGQPQSAYILIDGMTVMAGNTPKVGGGGKFRISKEDTKFITNRVIGVEVVCGPIDTVFFYHTDDTVAGGANTMIEVVRQAISDLSVKLKELKHPLVLPPKLCLQFDNCGENKNKFMFSYLSLLVEMHQFEEIEVNFLIVGHTHTTIDQYFGVISDAIKSCRFIGSPVSLWHLIEFAHPDGEKRPTMQRQIFVVHDYKSYLSPFINKVKFYQVPHCFWIHRVYSKAVMQYKLFSSHKTWLPIPPGSVSVNELADHNQTDVQLQAMCTVGSQKEFVDSLDLAGATENVNLVDVASNQKALDSLTLLSEMSNDIKTIELKGLDQLLQRCQEEEEVGIVHSQERYSSTTDQLAIVESYLKRKCSQKEGYIMWLKYTDSSGTELLDMTPAPLITVEACESILSSLPPEANATLDRNVAEEIGGDDGDSGSETGQLQRTRSSLSSANKVLKNKFKILKVAADNVFKNLRSNRFTVATRNQHINQMNVKLTRDFRIEKCDSTSSVEISDETIKSLMEEKPHYDSMELTLWEVIFYQKLTTIRGAVERYLSELRSLPPFTLINVAVLSEKQLEVIEQRKRLTYFEIQQNEELATRLLVKKNHSRQDGEQILEAMFGRSIGNSSSSQSKSPRCSVAKCTNFGTEDCSVS